MIEVLEKGLLLKKLCPFDWAEMDREIHATRKAGNESRYPTEAIMADLAKHS